MAKLRRRSGNPLRVGSAGRNLDNCTHVHEGTLGLWIFPVSFFASHTPWDAQASSVACSHHDVWQCHGPTVTEPRSHRWELQINISPPSVLYLRWLITVTESWLIYAYILYIHIIWLKLFQMLLMGQRKAHPYTLSLVSLEWTGNIRLFG